MIKRAFFSFLTLGLLPAQAQTTKQSYHDIVIYGGTSAGLIAGIQALKMDKSVVVIEPGKREGGLTTGGLGQTDIGNKMVIGGLSRDFYRRIAAHYTQADSWKWQKRNEYRDSGQSRTTKGEATMWTFEPSAALKIYQDWVQASGLEVIRNERLDRKKGVKLVDSHIVSITTESGLTFSGKMFLDCTYEGDLMAAAGVSFTVGREANAKYKETLNGVQTKQAKHHQFVKGVDPYVTPGDPKSGLLPFIDPNGPGTEGERDHRVQAYCFRMCLTDHPDNRIPFAKPEDYQEQWYELLLRNYEAGEKGLPWINSSMPNRKTDTNNRLGFSTDFIGQNYAWPEASYAEREAIKARHRLYQQGLMWTLAYHPRMPEKIRGSISKWGMCKDEFTEGKGWQEQLYVREARRMVGDFVMTQNHCQQREAVEDSVGMGAYTMDSHHVQRYIDEHGHVRNEGDVQVGGFPPYPISYRSIIPKKSECTNLLVPVCLSASHMAFGSIRMEPVFMVLGQSAATAASLAIDRKVEVQSVNYPELQSRLLADGQILDHQAPSRTKPNFTKLSSLKGIIVDDTQAKLTGDWKKTILLQGIHQGYLHDNDARDGQAKATFTADLPAPGKYEVQLSWSANPNRASNAPVIITFENGSKKSSVNQQINPPIDHLFHSLGIFTFGETGSVTISNEGTNGHVIIDAVRWIPVN
ncbi:FAD-dependent oxidoreductase [Akkermansiaceae bacterium]|nr:FAD-dependent oxidoreductase [Akkermansiaceae bacterium]